MGDILRFDPNHGKKARTVHDMTAEEIAEYVKSTPNIVKCEYNGMEARVWPAADGTYKVFVRDKQIERMSYFTFVTLEAAMRVYHRLEDKILAGEQEFELLVSILVGN